MNGVPEFGGLAADKFPIPTVRTPELEQFEREFLAVLPEFQKLYVGRSRAGSPTAGAQHREHRAHRIGSCATVWVDGLPDSSCICNEFYMAAAYNSYFAVRARFVAEPHRTSELKGGYAAELRWDFQRNNRIHRARIAARGGLVGTSNLRTGRTWKTLPGPVERFFWQEVVALAGSLTYWSGWDAFYDLLAERVALRAHVDRDDVRRRAPELFDLVVQTANEVLGEREVEIYDEKVSVPWATLYILWPLAEVPQLTESLTASTSEEGGFRFGDQLKDPDADVEREVEDRLRDEHLRATAYGRLALSYLARYGTEREGTSAVLLASALESHHRGEGVREALRVALDRAVELGEMEEDTRTGIRTDEVKESLVAERLDEMVTAALALVAV